MYNKVCKNPECEKEYQHPSRNKRYCSTGCEDRAREVRNRKNKSRRKRKKKYDETVEIQRLMSQCYKIAHRVAEMFLEKKCVCESESCTGDLELHHKDGNPMNNSPSNLEWRCKGHHVVIHQEMPNINIVDVVFTSLQQKDKVRIFMVLMEGEK